MAGRTIGVGIIGVQPGRSWGAVAHIPALRLLRNRFEIVGVANSSAASSAAAAAQTGAGRPFATPQQLIEDEAVDLVSICVKVPHHAALAKMAIDAGKHVVCEWPLALDAVEAADVAERASAAGVVALAGTQAVLVPAIIELARLHDAGTFGRLFCSTIVGNGMTWGREIEQRNVYLLDAENGATMLTIAVGHVLSAVEHVFGHVVQVSASLLTRRPFVQVCESGERVPLRAPDQVLLACRFGDGMPLSLHYRGGLPAGLGLSWEIHGELASARVTAPSGLLEMTGLTLEIDRHDGQGWQIACAPVDDPVVDGVQRLYEIAAQAIDTREAASVGFEHAARLHGLIDTIVRADRSGCTERVNTPKRA